MRPSFSSCISKKSEFPQILDEYHLLIWSFVKSRQSTSRDSRFASFASSETQLGVVYLSRSSSSCAAKPTVCSMCLVWVNKKRRRKPIFFWKNTSEIDSLYQGKSEIEKETSFWRETLWKTKSIINGLMSPTVPSLFSFGRVLTIPTAVISIKALQVDPGLVRVGPF